MNYEEASKLANMKAKDVFSNTSGDRVVIGSDTIVAKDGKVYLLVAHNGVARAVQSYFTDMTNEEFAKFGIKNCELKKYEFK